MRINACILIEGLVGEAGDNDSSPRVIEERVDGYIEYHYKSSEEIKKKSVMFKEEDNEIVFEEFEDDPNN